MKITLKKILAIPTTLAALKYGLLAFAALDTPLRTHALVAASSIWILSAIVLATMLFQSIKSNFKRKGKKLMKQMLSLYRRRDVRQLVLMFVVFALSAVVFGQVDPEPLPEFNIDLSSFWTMFVNMFNSLAPIVLPIVAIPVAISFLTWIGNQLKSIF